MFQEPHQRCDNLTMVQRWKPSANPGVATPSWVMWPSTIQPNLPAMLDYVGFVCVCWPALLHFCQSKNYACLSWATMPKLVLEKISSQAKAYRIRSPRLPVKCSWRTDEFLQLSHLLLWYSQVPSFSQHPCVFFCGHASRPFLFSK